MFNLFIIIIYFIIAVWFTGLLVHIIDNYNQLVYSTWTLITYCIYVIISLSCAILFWAIAFNRIAPYIQ